VTVATFLMRRILLSFVVLMLVTVVTFTIAHAVPGDPLATVVSDRVNDPRVMEAYRRKFGLDKPITVQYVYYMKNLIRGDLGLSITTSQPVTKDLRRFLPATLELSGAAIIFAIICGMPLGVLAALNHNRFGDHVSRGISLIGASIPVFYLALLSLYLISFRFELLPFGGRLESGQAAPQHVTGMYTIDALLAGDLGLFWDALKHLIQPAIVLGAFSMGIVARMVRSSLLEVLGQDYIRTARAKGLAERRVVGGHALRNAMIPTLTVMGLLTGSLLAGAVLTETTFAWPGLGRYAVDAASRLDFPAILGVTLISATIYIVVNLIVDILYGVLDPRIRQG
jgi:peptide/nickel transport system permease protein